MRSFAGRTKRALGAAVCLVAATALATACSAGGGTSTGSGTATGSNVAIPTPDGHGKTITVWSMAGDFSTKTLNAINAEFKRETGAGVKVVVQPWDNISTKVSTALAASNPPDVVDLAPAAPYGYKGAIIDLTPYEKSLKQGQTWIKGMEDAGVVNGKLYGAPSFATARVAIYNKGIWAKAGITTPPTTYAELTQDLDKIKAANPSPDFSAFYVPGQDWLSGLPWVWAAGGELYSEKNGTWQGDLSLPAAQKGLQEWQHFQNTYSSVASRTLYTVPPDAQIFAAGHAATIVDNAGALNVILQDNPKLTMDDLGTFAMPAVGGGLQPSLLAGSQWGIPVKSDNKDLALAWLKIAVSPDIATKYIFGVDGWIPNSTQAVDAAEASGLSAQAKAFFDAAKTMRTTVNSPNWPSLEDDNSLQSVFEAIATGQQSVSAAAKAFDDHAASVLNGNG